MYVTVVSLSWPVLQGATRISAAEEVLCDRASGIAGAPRCVPCRDLDFYVFLLSHVAFLVLSKSPNGITSMKNRSHSL